MNIFMCTMYMCTVSWIYFFWYIQLYKSLLKIICLVWYFYLRFLFQIFFWDFPSRFQFGFLRFFRIFIWDFQLRFSFEMFRYFLVYIFVYGAMCFPCLLEEGKTHCCKKYKIQHFLLPKIENTFFVTMLPKISTPYG